MPLYDFRCEKGHEFEHKCSSDDSDLPTPCTTEGCDAPASVVLNFGGLDHGIGCFSDAAKQGRFDENNLPTRYMSSGRAAGRRQH